MKAKLLLALCLATAAHADALHPLFRDGLWRHEFSGWLFPVRLGPLVRDGQPYSVDGNDDAAGALYGAAPGPLLVVDVFGRGSADARAGFDGARAAVAAAHPQLQATRAQPFVLPGRTGLDGQRIDFHPTGPAAAPLRLYFVVGESWVVSIQASGIGDAAAADALVLSLPWASLGSAERLH